MPTSRSENGARLDPLLASTNAANELRNSACCLVVKAERSRFRILRAPGLASESSARPLSVRYSSRWRRSSLHQVNRNQLALSQLFNRTPARALVDCGEAAQACLIDSRMDLENRKNDELHRRQGEACHQRLQFAAGVERPSRREISFAARWRAVATVPL